MDNIKIVSLKDVDEDKYAYAVCECLVFGYDYGIQIPRKKNSAFVKFSCPRCGKNLGMFVRGTKDTGDVECQI